AHRAPPLYRAARRDNPGHAQRTAQRNGHAPGTAGAAWPLLEALPVAVQGPGTVLNSCTDARSYPDNTVARHTRYVFGRGKRIDGCALFKPANEADGHLIIQA